MERRVTEEGVCVCVWMLYFDFAMLAERAFFGAFFLSFL